MSFRTECSEYLELLFASKSDLRLLRGSKSKPDSFISVARINREPRNMTPLLHRIADEWFMGQFGYKFRSSAIFCTSDEFSASHYGEVYKLVPVNGFRFCWSPKIKDLYTAVAMAGKRNGDSGEGLISLLNGAGYICSDLIGALKSENEIMIAAEKFYHFKFK